jgi:hypothetical protein
MIFCASPTDSEPGLLDKLTDRYPLDWSLLSADAPCGVRGLITEATFGAFATSAAAWLTALAYLESVNLPFAACRTIGLVPFACAGDDLLSVSVARWLSVPGSERLSLVLSPSRWETPTTATANATHTPRRRSGA